MDENTLHIFEAIESVVTVFAIAIGGIWAYIRFSRTREDHPKIQMDLDLEFIGIEGNRIIIECQATIENKGIVRHEISEFTFDLLHFSPNDEYRRGGEKVNNQVFFQKEQENRNKSWIPGDWYYSFVDPGVKQKYTYLADVPADCKYLLIHSKFKYKDKKSDFHTCQKAFNVEELKTRLRRNDS